MIMCWLPHHCVQRWITHIGDIGISFTAYERASTVLYRDVSLCTVSMGVEYACSHVRILNSFTDL